MVARGGLAICFKAWLVNLHGAKFEEIIGVINHVGREAADPSAWRLSSGILLTEGLIYGVNLRMRHMYTDHGLKHVSLTGKGWNLSFAVTFQRPRSMPDEQRSEFADIVLAPQEAIRLMTKTYAKVLVNSRASRSVMEPIVNRHCFHGGGIISPEEFRTEMTILRMFSSEWEL